MEENFVLIKNDLRITAGQKIVKGSEYQARLKADEIIAAARQVADRICSEADHQYQATEKKCRQMQAEMDAAYKKAQQQGYQDGLDNAQREYAAQINGALIDRAKIITQAEYSLVDMILASLKTILGDMGTDRTLQGIITTALRKAGRAQSAKLRVHPDWVERAQEVVQNTKEGLTGLEWIEVVADTSLQPTDCLLQTPLGILNISLETQLHVLQEHLYARVLKAHTP